MKIAVLLSGGVDSSVALRLLQEQGHTDLTAFYLKVWLEEELSFLGDCPWQEDLGLALKPAKRGALDDPVAIQLERVSQRIVRLRMFPPPGSVRGHTEGTNMRVVLFWHGGPHRR